MSLFQEPKDPVEASYTRINFLIRVCFWMVFLCLVIVLWSGYFELSEFAKGVITLILGRFSGYLDNIYNYEFGKTRTEAANQDKMLKMAQESPPGGASPGTKINIDNVESQTIDSSVSSKKD